MMWKKIFLINLNIIFIISIETSLAAGTSNVNIVGFSKNGKYIAYEITYYDDMIGTGFKKVRFVDVHSNRFVKTITVWDENEDVSKNERKVQKQIDYNLFKYQIVMGNTGNRLFQDETFLNPTYYQSPIAREKIKRNVQIVYGNKKNKKTYRVILKEIQIRQTNCPNSIETKNKPRIFELVILHQESLKILQKDTKLYQSRKCPYAYGIHQIYKYGNKIAIFIDSWTSGSEGPNIYKLIVTGVLP